MTFSRTDIVKDLKSWNVRTWFDDDAGFEHCVSVHTKPTRKEARAHAWEQFLKHCEPEIYQGEGI